MALFKKIFKNKINLNDQSVQLDDVLLSALLNNETITREKALTLPAVSGAVDFISGSIASMPVKLYKYKDGKVEEVQKDNRVRMLNGDTGNTLDGFQTKKSHGRGLLTRQRWVLLYPERQTEQRNGVEIYSRHERYCVVKFRPYEPFHTVLCWYR